jgi:PAS domain S-box-containing protein
MQTRKLGLRSVLAALVLAATVPLALFAGLLVLSTWQDQIAVADRQNVDTARAVAVTIDKEIENSIAALNVLATVDVLDTFDSKRFQQAALRLLAQQPGWLALMLLEPSGRVLENTADPAAFGSEESAEWVRTVAKTRRAAVSDLFEDPATRRHFVVVAVPVTRKGDNRYVLGARLSAARLSEILRQQNPPSAGVFTLIDGRHRIIARTRAEQEYVGKLPTPGFQSAAARLDEGVWRDTLLEGDVAVYAALSRSTLTGWTVGIGRSAEEIDGPIRRSIWWLGGVGLIFLALALSGALLLGQTILHGVRAVGGAAKALARSERVRPRSSRLAELDDLWRGLLDAQAILEQRLQERDTADRERAHALAAERSAREASEKDQARLAVTLRSIGDAVIATDAAGRITMMNSVAQTLTGWSEAEALERPIDEVFRIVNEETRLPGINPVTQVFEEGGVVGMENHTLLLARDGRAVPVADSAAPIRAADGTVLGVVLVFRDVTEARDAERMRAALLEREQAARREAEALSHSKDEFVAMVSHELRTPLSAIYGWTRLLRRGALDAAAQARALDVIERNTRAQTQLIDDLLDMSRVIRGNLRLELSAIDLAAVLHSAADAVRLAAEAKQIRLEVVIERPLAVSGDSDRLQQVFCNVLKTTRSSSRPRAAASRCGWRVQAPTR